MMIKGKGRERGNCPIVIDELPRFSNVNINFILIIDLCEKKIVLCPLSADLVMSTGTNSEFEDKVGDL